MLTLAQGHQRTETDQLAWVECSCQCSGPGRARPGQGLSHDHHAVKGPVAAGQVQPFTLRTTVCSHHSAGLATTSGPDPAGDQLGSAPWNLNRLHEPSGSQHSPVQPISKMILGHVCGRNSSHLEQNVPIDLRPAEMHIVWRKVSVWGGL